MARRDLMTVACMELAMRASAYGRQRGSDSRARLVAAMMDVHSKLPVETDHTDLDRRDVEEIVRAAMRLGRSCSLGGPDFRVIFNEVADEAPQPRHKTITALSEAMKGKVLQ